MIFFFMFPSCQVVSRVYASISVLSGSLLLLEELNVFCVSLQHSFLSSPTRYVIISPFSFYRVSGASVAGSPALCAF